MPSHLSPTRPTRSLHRTVRWTPDEWLTVRRRADAAGLRPSAYIRARALAGALETPKAPPYRRTGIGERRTIRKLTRWAPSEHERVLFRATSLNLPFSRYVREVALGHRMKSLADAHLIHHLNRIGQNLNQLSRAANTARQIVHRDALAASLARLDELLLRLL